MLMTLPGLPCVYNGDEVGAEFHPYDKPAVDWTDCHGLRAHFRRLIALRAGQPSLQSLDWTPVAANPPGSLFAYLRLGKSGDSPTLVVLNFSDDEVEAALDVPPEYSGMADASGLVDLYANDSVLMAALDGIRMPAWGIRILQGAR
jgi:glycosidase